MYQCELGQEFSHKCKCEHDEYENKSEYEYEHECVNVSMIMSVSMTMDMNMREVGIDRLTGGHVGERESKGGDRSRNR